MNSRINKLKVLYSIGSENKNVFAGVFILSLQWFEIGVLNMSLVMRKPAFCICENKDADQLRSNCAADQRLCFRYTDSTIPLLPKSENSSLQPSLVAVQPGLCWTWSETPKTGFLTTRLICSASTFVLAFFTSVCAVFVLRNVRLMD